jgi:hypothetical protein
MDFLEYVAAIRKAYAAGDATEHTHRPALKTLLESAGKNITATNEPRRIACAGCHWLCQWVRRTCREMTSSGEPRIC